MTYNYSVSWKVSFTKKAAKQYSKLHNAVKSSIDLLAMEITLKGPVRGNWSNYSKLSKTTHHCHLKRGNPTYVACWEVIDRTAKLVEVYYVGSHEKAPY